MFEDTVGTRVAVKGDTEVVWTVPVVNEGGFLPAYIDEWLDGGSEATLRKAVASTPAGKASTEGRRTALTRVAELIREYAPQ